MFSVPVLPTSLPPHPRLLASSAKFEELRSRVKSDAVSARLFASLQAMADQIMDQPPVEHRLIGRRLLAVSRLCLKRVSNLALVAVITGEQRYVDRACREMHAAAAFPNWNPSHFLDTAEMTLALAIGYDWLYDRLSPDDRVAIRDAIRDKGLRPSFDAAAHDLFWVKAINNWNQVCHAGLSSGAIALAEIEPALAEQTLVRAIENLPIAAGSYAPDGAYVEGPNYWDYGTSFHVVLIAALENLCGRTFGLEAFPGFLASADFIDQVTGPSGHFFNYADAVELRTMAVPKFWFARHLQCADLLRFEIAHLEPELSRYEMAGPTSDSFRLLPLALLWWEPSLKASSNEAPLHWGAQGINPLSVHRSAWDDPHAVFVAIKGGSASSPHAHMDAGSFVMEADGVRWAVDLGMQDYESLESVGLKLWDGTQDGDRWKIFRLGSEGHNIMRFNQASQAVSGKADIVRRQSAGPRPHSVVDLTPVYPRAARAVARGVALLGERAVLLQDEWTAGDAPVEVAWQMLTRAEVTPGKHELTLRQDGKTLHLRVLAPDDVEIEVRDVSQQLRPYDEVNPGVRRIVLRTQTSAGSTGTFRVLFALDDSKAVEPLVQSVLDWSAPIGA